MFKNINKYSEDQYSNNNLDTEYNNQWKYRFLFFKTNFIKEKKNNKS